MHASAQPKRAKHTVRKQDPQIVLERTDSSPDGPAHA